MGNEGFMNKGKIYSMITTVDGCGSRNLVKLSWEKGKIPRAEEVKEQRGQNQHADGSPTRI